MPPQTINTLPITHPTGQYNLLIGSNLLTQLAQLIPLRGDIALISDSNVAPLYATQLSQAIQKQRQRRILPITIPVGEQHKTLETVHDIYNQMLAAKLDRATAVVALGGGVVNDIAGFVAATYLRGIDFITCPTTLLAMVDASIGGKTGVDTPHGKNLIGAFKQPQAVIADLTTLQTLPPAEFAAGMAEIIKHSLIGDAQLFNDITTRPWQTEPHHRHLVTTAIQIKRNIIQADPFENGQRALLNLGHTFGHAIEQVSHYRIRHGEGVAMGLLCAAHLSATLGLCSPQLQPRIQATLQHVHLPTRIPPHLKPTDLLNAMQTDKKRAEGQLRFILPRDIGHCFIMADVPSTAVLNTLTALQE